MRAINESVIEEPETDFMTQFDKVKQRKEKKQRFNMDKLRKSRQIKKRTMRGLERMILEPEKKTEGDARREEKKEEEQIEGVGFLSKDLKENISNIPKYGITELKEFGKRNNVKGYSTWSKSTDRNEIAKLFTQSNVRLPEKKGYTSLRRFSS